MGIMGSVIMVGAGIAGCEAMDALYPMPLMLLPPQPASKATAATMQPDAVVRPPCRLTRIPPLPWFPASSK
jgi:hypothetical protein